MCLICIHTPVTGAVCEAFFWAVPDDGLPTNKELVEKKEEDMKVGMYTNSAAGEAS